MIDSDRSNLGMNFVKIYSIPDLSTADCREDLLSQIVRNRQFQKYVLPIIFQCPYQKKSRPSSLQPNQIMFASRLILRSSAPLAALRSTIARSYATAPVAKKSNALLYGFLAAGAGGAGYYAFNASEAVTVQAIEPLDYQKVYNAIAEALDSEDYDGEYYSPLLCKRAFIDNRIYNNNFNLLVSDLNCRWILWASSC